jgi:PIN domain nuclease of toxin-antitoxin system
LGRALVNDSFLLDTNVLYWILHDPRRLSPRARKAIQRGPLIASVASYWEVTIKSTRGTLPVKNPVEWWERAIDLTGAEVLPIRVNHVSTLHGLPEHHRDPFDRIIAAQAIADGYSLVASDPLVQKYPARIVW